MITKTALQIGAGTWAIVGFAVAMLSLATGETSAPLLVLMASVAFPACAAGAGFAVGRDRLRVAGLLLLFSVATPTYFFWIVNVPALVVGLALLVAPGRAVRDRRAGVPAG